MNGDTVKADIRKRKYGEDRSPYICLKKAEKNKYAKEKIS